MCGNNNGGMKCFLPRMNTNEHEYYFRSRKLFGYRFPASIREDSCSFVAKILFPESDGHVAFSFKIRPVLDVQVRREDVAGDSPAGADLHLVFRHNSSFHRSQDLNGPY